MIIYDAQRGRMADDRTGDYLTSKVIDWEEGEIAYTIHAKDDHPIFGARVRREAVDKPGEGEAVLVRFHLTEAWVPTGAADVQITWSTGTSGSASFNPFSRRACVLAVAKTLSPLSSSSTSGVGKKQERQHGRSCT